MRRIRRVEEQEAEGHATAARLEDDDYCCLGGIRSIYYSAAAGEALHLSFAASLTKHLRGAAAVFLTAPRSGRPPPSLRGRRETSVGRCVGSHYLQERSRGQARPVVLSCRCSHKDKVALP